MLPDEIWLVVASFIPNPKLRDCYSVNHLFYDLAMNLRYQRFELSPETCRHLENNSCSSRIKELILIPSSPGSWSTYPSPHLKTTNRTSLSKSKHLTTTDQLASIKKRILYILQSLVNVTSLSFIWRQGDCLDDWLQTCRSFSETVVSTLGLQILDFSLDLCAKPSSLVEIVDVFNFPNLTHFSYVNHHGMFSRTHHPCLLPNLHDFLAKHADTIRSIKVDQAFSPELHQEALLGHRLTIPNLKHLSFPLHINHPSLQLYHEALQRQIGRGLTSLELYVPPTVHPDCLRSFLHTPIPGLTSLKLVSFSMPGAHKFKSATPTSYSSRCISPYPYPEPSPLALILSMELPIHFTSRTFKTLRTLVLHIPIILQTMLNLLNNFSQSDAFAALTHLEVHVDFELQSIKEETDISEPISLLSHLFELMDGQFSNVETLQLIVLLSSRIKGAKHGERLGQAKEIIRGALYNSLPNPATSLVHISFFFATTCDRYIDVVSEEFGVYHLAPLIPLFPAPPDDFMMREIDIRTIQARFPKVEAVNGKNWKLWDEW